jgi:chromate transporter
VRADGPAGASPVPFGEALRVWLRVAMLSFGGPAGQIAVMHRILVDEKGWVSERRFLHALNYCMLLPGPEAQQLATYTGWLLHRTLGGLTAGVLFILPGFVAILFLSILYAVFQETALVQALFFGLKAGVLAVVLQAVIRLSRRALHTCIAKGIATGAFVAIFIVQVPFPFVILSAGFLGYVIGRYAPDALSKVLHRESGREVEDRFIGSHVTAERPSTWGTTRTAAVWLLLWLVPLGLLAGSLGRDHVFTMQGLFFSQAAVVTFGGAYAVLAFIAQRAVEAYGWLQPGEMLDGLGMAETTPGPLIQVVQFVGFMAAYRQPGILDPVAAGVIGSVITTWVTFVPCFLFIFVGAPYIEYLRGNRSLEHALSGITAAIVGVIASLALWFGVHVLFAAVDEVRVAGLRFLIPEWATLDPAALGILIGAAVALFWMRLGLMPTLALSTGAGMLYRLALGW